MTLRGAGEVGVPDVRRFSGLLVTDGETEQRESPAPTTAFPAGHERAAAPAPMKDHPPALTSVPTAKPASPAAALRRPSGDLKSSRHPVDRVLLGDERQVYLQADVPEVVLQRVKTVSFELADAHRHLSRHQTILGALVWGYVDHADQTKLDLLADLLDAYRVEGWHGLPEDRRLSGRVPVSLKRRVEGSVLALEHTHRDVSAKAVVAALVWRYVAPSDADEPGFARLVDIVGGYQQEVAQRSLTAPRAVTRST